MCTLAIFRGLSPALPLVVAANRDEFLARPTDGPRALSAPAGVIAGRDREAGGTWLGARHDGGALVAGLLNRRAADGPIPALPGARSRGLLCLDALGAATAIDALARVHGPGAAGPSLADYSLFNLLIADRERALVVDNGAGVRVTELDRGLSVLSNLDVNDPRCPRLASAVPRFERVAARLRSGIGADDLVAELQPVLASHESSLDANDRSELSRLCIHAGEYGTRPSTIIAYAADGGLHYFHAAGAPCETAYERVSW